MYILNLFFQNSPSHYLHNFKEFLWKMDNKLFGNLRDITRCTCILTKSSFHFSNTSVFSVFSSICVWLHCAGVLWNTECQLQSNVRAQCMQCSLIASAQPTPVWVNSDIWAPFTLCDLLQLLLTFKRNGTKTKHGWSKSWSAFIIKEENSDR